jgi:hypothetical protein
MYKKTTLRYLCCVKFQKNNLLYSYHRKTRWQEDLELVESKSNMPRGSELFPWILHLNSRT